jgi:NAD(P)-dependent dehydrogenase (short-subunit alcohol dehydrogenase family)
MLDGNVVLITGAKGGLGTFVTQAFLDAGAQVVGTSRSISAKDFSHPNFHAEPAELGNKEQASALVAKVLAEQGRIDTLVHLVGSFTGGTSVADSPDDSFSKMFEINVYSFLHITRAVIPAMRKQGSGAVLAIGSRTAVEPVAGLGAYTASKAALVSLVRTIALENKDVGISANVILPSTMDTPANRAAMPKADFTRWVPPARVAELLVHLAANRQVTGAAIPIYGGEL